MVEAVLDPIQQLEAIEDLWAEGQGYRDKIDQGKLLTTHEAKRFKEIMHQLEATL